MNKTHFGIIVVVMPIFFGIGMFQGINRNSDPNFLSYSLMSRSVAEFGPDKFAVSYHGVPKVLSRYEEPYGDNIGRNGASVPSSNYLTTYTNLGSNLEYLFMAAFGAVAAADKSNEPSFYLQRVPAFLGSLSGYSPGYFTAVYFRMGVDRMKEESILNEPGFKSRTANQHYALIIDRFIEKRKNIPVTQSHTEALEHFVWFRSDPENFPLPPSVRRKRNIPPDREDRATVFPFVNEYLKGEVPNQFRSYPLPSGFLFMIVVMVLSGIFWLWALIKLIR